MPTLGRPTLTATLASIYSQLAPGDEVIVVADSARGNLNATRLLATGGLSHPQFRYAECGSAESVNRGYEQREAGMRLAIGTHLAFMDDDDVYTAGALAVMREHAADVPVIFRMAYQGGSSYWDGPELRYGNVGTPMFLVPNRPAEIGCWEPHDISCGGDYTFISQTVKKMGSQVIWRDEVIALLRPAAVAA